MDGTSWKLQFTESCFLLKPPRAMVWTPISLIVAILFHMFVDVSSSSSVEVCDNPKFVNHITRKSIGTSSCHAYGHHKLSRNIPAGKDRHLRKSMKEWKLSKKSLLLETFPIDKETKNYLRQVRGALFSQVQPTPFEGHVSMAAFAKNVLEEILDMPESIVETQAFLLVVSGGGVLRGYTPLAHRYGGHQFGIWAGQLGDGRAHMLGEYVNDKGERWELQLKGSGKTPYSRDGDGRAVIRSSVREFLASEAMHYLGIPTSRAATLVLSDDLVKRDQFYNGNLKQERTAVVLRLARTWFRFGSFEILARDGEIDLLRKLAYFVIENYFPDVERNDGNELLEFFSHIVEMTAEMIAKWQSVGFAHGVCNTDNFSILSATIDYGPFRFMDEYDPTMVPNTSDDEHRYSYEKQPSVGKYNLEKMKEALGPLLLSGHHKKQMDQILAGYDGMYRSKYISIFRRKLGLIGGEESDHRLVSTLLHIMKDVSADFTMTFRQLGDWDMDSMRKTAVGKQLWAVRALLRHKYFPQWAKSYLTRLDGPGGITQDQRREIMHRANPRYVLRNWIAQEAIAQTERGNLDALHSIHAILQDPFTEQEEAELAGYADPPPSWAEHIKVSCSS